jgi:hypothetical protein
MSPSLEGGYEDPEPEGLFGASARLAPGRGFFVLGVSHGGGEFQTQIGSRVQRGRGGVQPPDGGGRGSHGEGPGDIQRGDVGVDPSAPGPGGGLAGFIFIAVCFVTPFLRERPERGTRQAMTVMRAGGDARIALIIASQILVINRWCLSGSS